MRWQCSAVWGVEVDEGETLGGGVICCELLGRGKDVIIPGDWLDGGAGVALVEIVLLAIGLCEPFCKPQVVVPFCELPVVTVIADDTWQLVVELCPRKCNILMSC